MKRVLLTAIILTTLFLVPASIFAQGMMGTQSAISSDGHTDREEQKGEGIWERLQAKEVTCDTLSNKDFGALGEYFMGQMAGSSHEAMNNMMVRMMGEEGEKQMHIAMGKRLSSCDTSAQVPSGGIGFMPMMWMMGGGGNPMMGTGWGNMMGGWGSASRLIGVLGWLSMLVFLILLILGVIALIRYLDGSRERGDESKSPIDILKERYARGEIDKKKFEEMKKDLR